MPASRTQLRDTRTVLQMLDIKGRPRIMMSVPAEGEPVLEFLDEEGNVTARMPEG